jgi:hypothetical protein
LERQRYNQQRRRTVAAGEPVGNAWRTNSGSASSFMRVGSSQRQHVVHGSGAEANGSVAVHPR